nr:MAG TPA: hypothetical protein [Caudoviricetes sp.]
MLFCFSGFKYIVCTSKHTINKRNIQKSIDR